MNILFLTIYRITDVSERGIYTDLLRKFRDEGHNVYIVSPTERKYKERTSKFLSHGITVLNVKTLNFQKANLLEKGIGTLLVERQFSHAVKKYYAGLKFDLVIYSTPPITFTKVVEMIKRRDGAVSYLLLKDIFPQNAVDLGFIKKDSFIHRYFKYKEKALYDVSDYIGCMSPANRDYIVANNPDIRSDKVEVNPNSIDGVDISLGQEEKLSIKNTYGIPPEATVFIYGGNLGKPQGIDFLLQVLQDNKLNSMAFFVVVGSGTEYPKLVKWREAEQPKNFLLMEHLPKKQYDELLSACDVGMIFLDKKFTIPNFPSRLLSYLEYKIPVVAALDMATDMGRIMESNNFGKWCLSGESDKFGSLIKYFCNNVDERAAMGANGYSFMQNNYLAKHSYNIIVKHLNV